MPRPEKFKKEYVKIAAHACQLGATDADLAAMFGVCLRTVHYWKATKEDFAAALKVGKDEADARVERSLYERAMGYEHREDKIFCTDGKVTTVETVKRYAPDTTAMIFWLKNRKPDEWRDKRELDVTQNIDDMTEDEVDAAIAELKAEAEASSSSSA